MNFVKISIELKRNKRLRKEEIVKNEKLKILLKYREVESEFDSLESLEMFILEHLCSLYGERSLLKQIEDFALREVVMMKNCNKLEMFLNQLWREDKQNGDCELILE